MGRDIDAARLKTTIEMDTARMKKGAETAKRISRDMAESVNKNLDKVKNPLGSMAPKNIFNGFKDRIKKFQLDAGIKVHTDAFLDVEKDIAKAEGALKKLRMEEEALRRMDADQGMTEKYRKARIAAEEAETALNKLLKKQEELEASDGAFEFSPKYRKLYDSYGQEKGRLSELRAEQARRRKLGLNMADIMPDGTLVNITEEIRKAEASLQKLASDMEALEEKGKMLQPTKAMETLGEKIESARDKLGKYKNEMTDLTADGLENGTEEWIRNQKAIEKTTRELEKHRQVKRNLEASGKDVTKPVSFGRQALNFGGSVLSKGWGGMAKLIGGMEAAFSRVSPVIRKVSGVFGALIQRFTAGIPILNRTRTSMNGIGSSGRGLTGILSTLGMTARFMLASFIIRGALDGAKEGFQNLAQYSDRTNRSLSLLMSSMTQLKNALAAAFAPVLNVVAPILDTLIQKVISVINVFGQLTSALTGSGTYIRAKKVNQDYAASLDQNASSADKAKKANEELQGTLMGFDRINKLDDYKNTQNGALGGTGAGTGSLSPGDMFETVEIKSQIKSLADKLRAYIRAEDWEGLGKELAGEINKGLLHIYRVISWDNAGPRITKFTNAFARTLNSLVDNINWDLMGRTAGAGINTIVNTLNGLIGGISFGNIGKKLSEGLRGAIGEIQWGNLGNLLGNKFMIMWNMLDGFVTDMSRKNDAGLTGWAELGISVGNVVNGIFEKIDFTVIGDFWANGLNGIFEILKNFTETVDWDGIAVNLYTGLNRMIQRIDWASAGKALSLFVTDLLGTFVKVAQNTDWEGFGRGIGEFLSNIDWFTIIGQVGTILWETFSGVLAGLFDTSSGKVIIGFGAGILAIKGLFKVTDLALTIGQWVTGGTGKFSLLSAAASGLVSKIGPVLGSIGSVIFSPTGILVAGVAAGVALIVTHWDEVKKAAGEVKDWISEKWEMLKEGTAEIWGNITTSLGNTWEGLKNTASTAFENVKTVVSDTWGNIRTAASTAWENISSTIGGAWDSLSATASEKFEEIKTSVSETWENIKTAASEKWGEITTAVGDTWNDLTATATEKFGEIRTSVSDTWDEIKTTASDKWGSIKKTVGGFWDKLTTAAEDKFSTISDSVSEAWDAAKKKSDEVWKSVKTTVGGIWEKLTTTATEKFGSISETVSDTWETAKTESGKVWDSIKSTLGSVWDWLTGESGKDFPEIEKNAKDSFKNTEKTASTAWGNSSTSVKDSMRSMRTDVDEGMQKIFKNVKSYSQSVYNTITDEFRWAGDEVNRKLGDMDTDIGEAFRGISDTISNAMGGISNSVNGIVSSFGGLGYKLSNSIGDLSWVGRNAAISLSNGIRSVHIPMPHIDVDANTWRNGSGYSYRMNSSVRWYANGGFPNAGELFMARESGPELVGRMGNKNAVANNSQIVDGIKAGVYEAVRAAFSSGGNQGGDTNVTITLEGDAKGMFKVIRTEGQKYQKSTGKPVFE